MVHPSCYLLSEPLAAAARKVSDLYGELEQGRCCLELERCLGMSGDGDAGDLWGFGELVPGGFWGDFWDDFFWDSWDFMMEYIRFVGFMGGFMIYGGLWGFIRCFFL